MRLTLLAALASSIIPETVLAAFDQNRAGAVLKAPDGDSFTSVTGTFTVPSLTGTAKLSIWVALGDTLQQDTVLKGGITFAGEGTTSFTAWYPANETDITTEVPVAAGDSITVTVSVPAEDKSTGTVVVENTTQGKVSERAVPAPETADPATLTTLAADWFVQAYQANGELVQVPSFDPITFTDCSAALASGTTVGPEKAGRFEIQGTSGQIYSATTVSEAGVVVTRSSGFGL
ncbi:peptidase G1 [Xylariomycetidae sp. FL2044]|nr:peptidase G1 [Xylariomycetidae sp. FL2044]